MICSRGEWETRHQPNPKHVWQCVPQMSPPRLNTLFDLLCFCQKIPEEERWECRKNALTEDIRRYFDTEGLDQSLEGIQSLLGPNQRRPPARPKTASVEDLQALGNRPKESGDTKAIGIGEHPAPQEDAVSIAALFGWGYGGDNVDDY